MILAMASTTAIHEHDVKNAKERIQESDVFYQRAFGLCQTQMLRGTSLETGEHMAMSPRYMWLTDKSAISFTHDSVSSRYTEICADLDDSWIGSQVSPLNRPPLPQRITKFPPYRTGDEKANLVRMCYS